MPHLAHPGGNITGFTFIDFEMIGKWLQLLKEIAPGVIRAGLMFNPDLAPYFHFYLREFGAIRTSLAVEITAAPVHDPAEIEAVIARLGRAARWRFDRRTGSLRPRQPGGDHAIG